MRPYGGFAFADEEDELLELEEFADDFLLEDEELDFVADGELEEEEAEGDADEEAEGDEACDSEYAGTSDVDPALAAAWTAAETDWLFCCAALT